MGQGSVPEQLYAHFTGQKVESNAAFPIESTVRSFILWHLAVVLTFNLDFMLAAILFYIMFEISLRLRPEKGQI